MSKNIKVGQFYTLKKHKSFFQIIKIDNDVVRNIHTLQINNDGRFENGRIYYCSDEYITKLCRLITTEEKAELL